MVLDEPTAGIDAQARHGIWDLLQKEKKRRACILLTTHYMEEVHTLSSIFIT